jgi:hypothetical protein
MFSRRGDNSPASRPVTERDATDPAEQVAFEQRMLAEREAWLKNEAAIEERQKDDSGSRTRNVLLIAFTALLWLDVAFDRVVLHRPLLALTKSAGLAAFMLVVMRLYRKPSKSELLLGGALALLIEVLMVIAGRL